METENINIFPLELEQQTYFENIQTILLYLIAINSAILACLLVLAFFLGRSSK